MTDWRTDDDKVRAVLHEEHEPVPELTYERLILLAEQGYEMDGLTEKLTAARQAERDEVRQARGDTRASWAAGDTQVANEAG